MFDLFSGTRRQIPRRGTIPLYLSVAAHLLAIGVIGVPLLLVATELPQVPAVLAFVAEAPAPPPPPPPPAAPRPAKAVSRPAAVNPRSAPIEPAKDILPERSDTDSGDDEDLPAGVEGGVPGGIPGGIVGGVISNEALLPPPPPPPPAPVNREPVRVGGAITAPALVSRVAPEYPNIAVNAHVQGVVVLEAVVGRDGRVEEVKVLRSIPLLDAAAIAAVRQWRYSPLLLNGQPQRFVLTVTVSFSVNP